MKKKILFLLCTFIYGLNVKAASLYSEYNFIGYILNPQIESDTYRYEEVHLHKYYQMGETNIVYAPINTTIPTSPYVDSESSGLLGHYYLRSKTELGTPRPIIYAQFDNSFLTKTVMITNLNTYNNSIYEIEIFNNDEKINYNISDYSFLNDGNLLEGENISNGNLTLDLINYYDLKDIKVLIHYGVTETSYTSFLINFIHNNSTYKRFGVVLDNYRDTYKTKWIEFKEKEEFANFFAAYGMYTYDVAYKNVSLEAYEYDLPLYKHYNLDKQFYTYSFLDSIDGYTYDENDDLVLYKIYAREYLGEEIEENIPSSDDEVDTIEEIEREETNKEEEVKISNNDEFLDTNKETNEVFIYRAIPVNNNVIENTCLPCEEKECICECPTMDIEENVEVNSDKKTIIVIVFAILILFASINLIKLIYDKFTGK